MDNEKRIKTSIFFNKSDHTKIKIFCAENDMSIQDFLENAGLYCIINKIKPEENKK